MALQGQAVTGKLRQIHHTNTIHIEACLEPLTKVPETVRE